MQVSLIQQKFTGNKETTRERTVQMISESKGELVVLQELHQTEYFCKSENPSHFKLAETFKEDLEFWLEVSQKEKRVLVTSLFEKGLEGVYYNTAVVMDKGKIAGFYRKTHIPDDPGFYEKFYFTPGEKIIPIDTSVGRLGVLICWDQWYPEPARLMTLAGAEILIYPTAIGWLECPTDRFDALCEQENSQLEREKMWESWIGVQRGHAIANGIPVVTVNRVGFEPDQSGVLGGITFWGSSFGFGPQGELLGMGSRQREEIVELEIDLKKGREIRKIWPFLRDRRIELYRGLTSRTLTCSVVEKLMETDKGNRN